MKWQSFKIVKDDANNPFSQGLKFNLPEDPNKSKTPSRSPFKMMNSSKCILDKIDESKSDDNNTGANKDKIESRNYTSFSKFKPNFK